MENDLCVRCGGCAAVCPPDNVITLDDDGYPRVNYADCIDCRLCLRVCPMADMDLPAIYHRYHGTGPDPEGFGYAGPIRQIYVGHSTDPEIRMRGSSGGVAVQLMISLLEQRAIDAATVVVPDKEKPWDFCARLASTREEVLESSGSKYTIIPLNEALRDTWKRGLRLGVVALPCQLQSLRQWEGFNSKLQKSIVLSIGLFCVSTLTKQATEVMAGRLGIKLGNITRVEYRHGTWPGGIQVQLRDGHNRPLHSLDVKYGAMNYLGKTYYPKECLNCIDHCAELADIALADPWLRGPDGDYLFKDNWSMILTRTERGEEFLDHAVQRGELILKPIDHELFYQNVGAHAKNKYHFGTRRIERARRTGNAFPNLHVPVPSCDVGQRLRLWLYGAERLLGRWEFTRRAYLYFGLSGPGVVFSRIKAAFKRWKYRRRQRRAKYRNAARVTDLSGFG